MSDSTGVNDTTAGGVRLGMWIDDSPSRVLSIEYAAELKRLGVAVAAVMVDGNTLPDPQHPEWRPSWTEPQLADASALFRNLDIEMILTCWPVPQRDYLHTVCTEMGALIEATGAAGFEVDTEGLWRAEHVAPNDFSTLSEAGTYLAAAMRQAAPHASLQLTTYPFHAEFSADNTVSRYMDAVAPQAYSTTPGADGNRVAWGDLLGPGRLQDLAITRARTIKPDPVVVCGLAAYHQGFAGHSRHDAMDTALQTAVSMGCTEVRYWSSKWILGSQRERTPFAADFVHSQWGQA